MKHLPSLSQAKRKYEAALRAGQGIDSITSIEQMIVRYTPMSLFQAFGFRRKLIKILKREMNKSSPDISSYVSEYAPRGKEREFTTILLAAIEESQN